MCWERLNKAGAAGGVIAGLVIGFVAWFVLSPGSSLARLRLALSALPT